MHETRAVRSTLSVREISAPSGGEREDSCLVLLRRDHERYNIQKPLANSALSEGEREDNCLVLLRRDRERYNI